MPLGGSPPYNYKEEVSVGGSPPVTSTPHGDEPRGGFSNASPSVSPRAAYRLPVRRNNAFQSFGDYLGSSPTRDIPAPMHPQYSRVPPLPHHPQAHFYGAPGYNTQQDGVDKEDKKIGVEGCCIFDSLASAGDIATTSAENVLLVGFDKGLEIYKIEKDKCQLLGRLDGLRGTVIGAKILPCTSREDSLHAVRPLIVVIIHGPVQETQSADCSKPGTGHSDDVDFDPSDSMLQAMHSLDTPAIQSVTHFHTTVEVYSLNSQKHLATLFASPAAKVEINNRTPAITAPLPIGNLSIQAKGKFIVVACGDSGEVYIYEIVHGSHDTLEGAFRCIGKTWTSMPTRKPRSWSSSSASSDVESLLDASTSQSAPSETPMVSLSHRWLVTVPPLPSSRSTIHGTVGTSSYSPKPPGLTSHTAPSQPQVTCALDTPGGDSAFNRIARDVAQEVIRGARWVGGQGVQAFKNYWYKPVEASTQTSKQQQGPKSPMVQQPQQYFPPTHAPEDRNVRVSNQPALITILDLEKLSHNQDAKPAVALHPISTFSLPSGCSSVSFSPSGLGLFTASAKGDVQHVWDLMRMVHGKSGAYNLSDGATTDQGPTVRQVAQFTRITTANIVDVIWTEPRGDRLAIITDRGTVHIFDLPASAFLWPPPRRIARPASAPGEKSDDLDKRDVSAPTGSAFSTAINMVNGRTQPLLSAVRGRPTGITNAFSGFGGFNIPAGAGAKGGKVVAVGISKSVGAAAGTVNTIRHMGENRLHIPGSLRLISPGCVRWLTGKDRGLIAVVGGDFLRLHSVRQSANVNPGKRRPSVLGGKPIEIDLPVVPSNMSSTSLGGPKKVRSGGCWRQASTTSPLHRPVKSGTHPLSYAEIETNAPYQPFHTDRRINLYAYDSHNGADIHHLYDNSPWVFGEDVPSTKIGVGSRDSDEHGNMGCGVDGPLGPMENLISLEGDVEQGQHVVVTTRRKRGRRGGGSLEGEEEDFFEDGCEVVDFAEDRV